VFAVIQQIPLDLALAAVLVLPGVLVARLLRPAPTLLQAVSESLLCTLIVVPVPAFTVALLSRSYLGLPLLLACSAITTIIALGLLYRRNGGNLWQRVSDFSTSEKGDVHALLAAVCVLFLFAANYDRDHFQYACINGVVMQAISPEAAPPIDPHEEEGPIRSREREHGARMDLIDAPGTGQRYGTTTIITPWVVLFDLFGFRLIYALIAALCLLFGVRLARHFCPRPSLALLAAALSLCNPYVLKIVILDENVMAMAFATAALALALEGGALVTAGLALGVTIGIRHVDAALALTLVLLIPRRPRELLTLFASAALALVPCFLHHQFTYGSPFSHEHFIDEVFQATPHSLFGWEFGYTGLLNLPFAEQWIRTPYNPFPTSVYYPLNVASHLGSLLCALALLGGIMVIQRHRKVALALVTWALPLYALLAVLENWMDPNKMGLILCLFPLLTLAFAAGFAALDVAPESRYSQSRWLLLAVLCLIVSCVSMGASKLAIPDDARFYSKYPEVRVELPTYLEFERSLVTRGSPLPSWYALQQYSALRPVQRLRSLLAEYTDRRLRRPTTKPQASRAPLRSIEVDLSRPWVSRRDFVRSRASASQTLDLSEAEAGFLVGGLSAWDKAPAELRVVRDGPAQVSIYLRFGGEPFAEVQSERLFSIEEVQRPQLEQRTLKGSKLPITLRDGDRLRLYETISMDEVLVYTWEVVIGEKQAELGLARRMFHN
jgi:hypothetical protein